VRELADFPVRVWGPGWRGGDATLARRIAGGYVDGPAKLAIYCGATLSLNPHHPMNDIVGVNTRAFELAAAGACQVVDLKEELPQLFKPGEEAVAYRDLAELRRQLTYYLAHPDEARAIGENARRRAMAEHTVRHRVEEIIATMRDRLGRA
jgi:spore maturation protein CgeB